MTAGLPPPPRMVCSLDGHGRVEDHWIQTELGGLTYLDTEPWRGEPLLDYLRKMVFWSDVRFPWCSMAGGFISGRMPTTL